MTTLAYPRETANAGSLLPSAKPLQLIDHDGLPGENPGGLPLPAPDVLCELHRRMVLGRRFDSEATALTKQGRLAVYPSSRGQDACQVGAVLALRDQDWLFPTYRDSVALLTRGVPAEEALTLLRGDWHCGYDPYEYRVAPQCTPLATNTLHAVGLAYAARLKKQDQVALALLGDGAGPTLIEAVTYRIEAHTNADDATRYRTDAEVSAWLERDPIARLAAYLKTKNLLDDAAAGRLAAEAEQLAGELRDRMNADVSVDPAELFEHVYAQPTAALERQRAALLAELQGLAEQEEHPR